MIIRIEFDDGREVVLSGDLHLEEAAALVLNRLAEAPPAPERCPHCQFGRIGALYCLCPLGRDLKRIETRGLAKSAEGME
jgi:hypothetical protein